MKPPKGWIEIPDTTAWHSATCYYLSSAFNANGDRVWVRGPRLTVKPGETWQDAYHREIGVEPDSGDFAFVPAAMYERSTG
jgi:hypothetical protein